MRYHIVVSPDPTERWSAQDLSDAFDDLPGAIEGLLEEGETANELRKQRTNQSTVVAVDSHRSLSELKSAIKEAFRHHRLFGDVQQISK